MFKLVYVYGQIQKKLHTLILVKILSSQIPYIIQHVVTLGMTAFS